MAIVTSHLPGAFCWVELGTTDQAAAKNFYGMLFGWGLVLKPLFQLLAVISSGPPYWTVRPD